jgi:TolB-like protein/DNA-binding winged helix-turn-helix (wHTH) protein/Tfp pilus assembly protein PilF
MKAMDSSSLRIGAWRVDPALDQISKDGNAVKLERRAMQLLLCLADHAGQVISVEELLDQVWAGVVVTPDSVYHAVAALRRTLGDDTKEPSYIANIPRRGYRLIASVAPWVDAPQTLEDSPSPPAEPARAAVAVTRTGSLWRRFAIVLSIAFVAALGYVVIYKFWLSKSVTTEPLAAAATKAAPDKSIAVLPFVDMSEKKDQEYFADGMAEEIIDLLAKIPPIKVIGRTSSFQFKGKNEDLRTIGAKLGVAYVLEGSVRRSADRVRVTAQLVDTRDGAHLWSETYDRPASDVLQLQGEIATTLSRSLEIGIGADRWQSTRRLKNDEAYDLYLRGRYAIERGDTDGMTAAATYLRQALDADPTFADAALALALTYYGQANTSLASSGVFEQARQAAESALRLDPGLGLAHAVLGGIHTDYDWNWSAADREFKQAIALAPHNGLALTIAADLPISLGHLDVARQMLKEALAYDPLSAVAYINLAWTELCSGRYAEAEAAARRALEIDPSFDWGHIFVGDALLWRGDPEAAVVEMKRESEPIGQALGLALAYYALGRAADSDAALSKLTAEGAANYAYEIAEVYAYRGERDQALKWLDRAYVQRDATLRWIKRDPSFAKLEAEPRYQAFVRKMNLPE